MKQATNCLGVEYAGPKDEAVKAMAPILNLGPSYSLIKEMPRREISTQSAFLLDSPVCVHQQIYDVFAVNVRNFSASAYLTSFNKLAGFWAEHPAAQKSVILLETWPIQGVIATSDDDTAYPWRDTTTYA